jgi:hypothetical protein
MAKGLIAWTISAYTEKAEHPLGRNSKVSTAPGSVSNRDRENGEAA